MTLLAACAQFPVHLLIRYIELISNAGPASPTVAQLPDNFLSAIGQQLAIRKQGQDIACYLICSPTEAIRN